MKIEITIVLFFCIVIFSCKAPRYSGQKDSGRDVIGSMLKIPNIAIDKTKLDYDNKTSLWSLDKQIFSGFAISLFQDSSLQERIAILEGKKQNTTMRWYPDGHLKQIANYHKGKLHGVSKKWSSDSAHCVIAELNYHMGKAHGQQKVWYPSGELFKKLNLNMGREEGIQQAYRKNGALYANYEAKAGRTFGLRKAALCYGIEDEIIRYEE